MAAQRTIVYVTEYYPPFGAGGAERTAALHAQLLARSGQSVAVVTPNYGALPREVVRGVEVIRFPFERLAGRGAQVSPFRFFAPSYHREVARQIVDQVGSRRIRCLHAQNAHSMIGADLAARRLSVPLVTHIRDTSGICGLGALCLMEAGMDQPPPACGAHQHTVCHVKRYMPLYQPGATLKRRLAGAGYSAAAFIDFKRRRRIYERATRIAFASEGLRQVYRAVHAFQDEAKHRIVHAPVLEEDGIGHGTQPLPAAVEQAKRSGAKIILYAGKVSRGKGADVLFAAHREVLQNIPDAVLVVAGTMDPHAWDYDHHRTILLGFVDPPTLSALYRASDVVVLPSSWPEPLGWATLEAGRYAKPIVATRVGGIPEGVVDRVTGLLVEKLDSHGMCQALHTVLSDSAGAREMGAKAHAFIFQRFGEAAIRRELEELYRGL